LKKLTIAILVFLLTAALSQLALADPDTNGSITVGQDYSITLTNLDRYWWRVNNDPEINDSLITLFNLSGLDGEAVFQAYLYDWKGQRIATLTVLQEDFVGESLFDDFEVIQGTVAGAEVDGLVKYIQVINYVDPSRNKFLTVAIETNKAFYYAYETPLWNIGVSLH
jgi:hypothetical protein